jgi:CHAT domain-containing protein/tetratricopeptide (TPR) repeat protein
MFIFSVNPVPARTGLKITLILFLAFSFFIAVAQQPKPPSAADFKKQMIDALGQNNDDAAFALMESNRFMLKPFVEGLARDAIKDELKGNLKEYDEKKAILKKTAGDFESLFGEKSLSIAVGYLSAWNMEQKQKKLVADSIYAAGTKLRLAKDFARSLPELDLALKIYGEIGDERGEAEVLGSFGVIYFESDYEKCIKYYSDALAKREKVDDKQLIGNTLNSFGSVNVKFTKNYADAISWYERAEALRKEIGDMAGLRTTYGYKAGALKLHAEQLNKTGNYQEALGEAEKAAELFRMLNNKSETGEVLSLMGFIYSNLGDNVKAVGKLDEALTIKTEINDSIGIAGVYNHYGIVLKQAGRTANALEYYNNAFEIYQRNGLVDKSIPILNNIGTIYFTLKDYSTAEDYHKRGLQLSREFKMVDLEAHNLLNLANDQLMLGKTEEAGSSYNAAIRIARSLNSPELIWKVYAGMAETYEAKGEYERAVELNDSLLVILDGMRNTLGDEEFRSSFLAKERYVFEDIVNLLRDLHMKSPDKGYDIQAFGYAERSKSRSLLDILGTSSVSGNASRPMQTVSVKEVQEMCRDKNTLFLAYMTGDSSSTMWAISKTRHAIFRVPQNKTLKEQIEAIRFALLDPEQPASEFFVDAATALYDELIKPAGSFFTKSTRLIIIPDGILNYLPFEVLITPRPQNVTNVTYQGLPFIIKKYPVSYSQSASILKGLLSMRSGSDVKPSEKKLLAFGDPVYEKPGSLELNGQTLDRLQYSGQEVEKIASLFRKEKSEVFLRENATEANLKGEKNLESFNYLHFATHGYIDENNPGRSSLVLTRGKDDINDGLLKSDEIFNLKLRTDLVVLSACQTGLGKLVRGEGIVGLTRAFMYAGTPSVLVSLWSVSDNSTASLMEEFYKNLVTAGLNKTDALRKAQLTLMSDVKFAHPFYWAPFVLIGDWR